MKFRIQIILATLFAVALTQQLVAVQPGRYDWAEEIRTLSRPDQLPATERDVL